MTVTEILGIVVIVWFMVLLTWGFYEFFVRPFR